MSKYFRFRFICAMVLLALFSCCAALATLYWAMVVQPLERLHPENIHRILSVESPVYYQDGRNKLGVFFEEAHRQYVPFEQIPRQFIDCLIAAEDASFFNHFGVEPASILRAAVANLTAGRVVQGGSTITQQTVKNLFGRSDRTLRAKLDELLWALRLEYHYSKEKILEFYVNQFFVSGNGRGLAMAARYYFDKEVKDLDLLECAFIAGSLNRPNYYNPFIKRDAESAEEARHQAKIRTGYVLRQMGKAGFIDTARLAENLSRDIPFRQGQMAYSFDTAMELVEEALAEPEVAAALEARDIDNVATSGIRIVTTLNHGLQQRTLSSLQRALSRLDTIINGYNRDELRETYRALAGSFGEKPAGDFRFGRVVTMDPSRPEALVRLDGERENTPPGVIDEQGLLNLADALVKFRKSRWQNATGKDARDLARELREDDRVFVRVRAERTTDGRPLLSLEKYPELQGATLVLREGRILAMAGGMDNRNFNRALAARRNLGGVFTPIVYAAALQLGWSSIDSLENARNLFLYQRRVHAPRPDHKSSFSRVSLSWAGVLSENVATTWLLQHLCDRLSPAHFQELAVRLGLTRQANESETVYQERLRDRHGIVVNQDALLESAFRHAAQAVAPDLAFGGRHEELEHLERLSHGPGEMLAGLDALAPADRQAAKNSMERHFIGIERSWRGLSDLRADIERGGEGPVVANLFRSSVDTRDTGQKEIFIYTESAPAPEWRPLSRQDLEEILSFRSDEERRRFWDGVQVDGLLSAETVEELLKAHGREYARLTALPPYSLAVLQEIRDFRVLTGLTYLVNFCRALGIDAPLDPGLSLALGGNDITLFEAVRAYEGLTTGRVTRWGEGAPERLAIIDRIESSGGEVIYRPARSARTVLDPRLALSVSDILRNVVRWGTGSSAAKAVLLKSHDPEKALYLEGLDVRVPVLGKTGTADDYRNAAFVGMVPEPRAGGSSLQLANGYLVGTYVGFDSNAPMIHNAVRISGALGALPPWMETAGAVVLEEDFAGRMDSIDVSFAGLKDLSVSLPDYGQIRVAVANDNGGLPVSRDDARIEASAEMARGEASILYFPAPGARGEVLPERFFLPYWMHDEDTKDLTAAR